MDCLFPMSLWHSFPMSVAPTRDSLIPPATMISVLKHRITIKSPSERKESEPVVVAVYETKPATTPSNVLHIVTHHWLPCVFGVFLLFFMGVEYTLAMVPSLSLPFDLGFVATCRLLSSSPDVNTFLAFLNTTTYILWTWLIEGRPRATIATLFMFTCRGILGYSTQLPLPEEFLGSGVDFPIGNVSFFLFFSGHVAGSVIASLDMSRVQRHELARLFDALNILQLIRLLGTRGHCTIDQAAGLGAGILFDALAGKYKKSKMDMNRVGFVNEQDRQARRNDLK